MSGETTAVVRGDDLLLVDVDEKSDTVLLPGSKLLRPKSEQPAFSIECMICSAFVAVLVTVWFAIFTFLYLHTSREFTSAVRDGANKVASARSNVPASNLRDSYLQNNALNELLNGKSSNALPPTLDLAPDEDAEIIQGGFSKGIAKLVDLAAAADQNAAAVQLSDDADGDQVDDANLEMFDESKPFSKPNRAWLPPFKTSNGPPPTPEIAREMIKEAFLHSWRGYEKYAWGFDELRPVTKVGKNWFGLGLTIIDAITTMQLMGLEEETKVATEWIAENLDINRDFNISVFETTIRVLGGLLSAYDHSKNTMFLNRAIEVARTLLESIDDASGFPWPLYNPVKKKGLMPKWHQNSIILSEAGTLQLEFLYLAVATNDSSFATRIMPLLVRLDELAKPNGLPAGLYPNFVHMKQLRFVRDHVAFGALGDSFYEYLLKLWLFTGKRFPRLKRMYMDIAAGARNTLILKSTPSNLTYISEWKGRRTTHRMDHMACFVGGLFALASQNIASHRDFLQIGAELCHTCYEIYYRQKCHLSPESVTFKPNLDFTSVKSNGLYYLLRPEAIESFFVLWRYTHDERFRRMGWEIFLNIEKNCKIPGGGYSGIKDVTKMPFTHDDVQQTFLLAETFKYLYLLFSDDDVLPLDKYVLNTEAHPLRILSPEEVDNNPVIQELMEPFKKPGFSQGGGGVRPVSAIKSEDLIYLGCYVDSKDRDLPILAAYEVNSVAECAAQCHTKNQRYFSLQIGFECWCGNSYGKHGKVDDSECNKFCRNDHKTCGGEWRGAVYSLKKKGKSKG